MNPIVVDGISGIREPFASFSHMLAIPVFVIAGYFLVRRARGNPARQISVGMMAAATVFMLIVSSIYHIYDHGPVRYLFWQLDMASIFVLIAATVTPLHMVMFQGFNRWTPIALIWLAAVVGITLRNIYAEELMTASDALFVLMGWGGAYSVIILWRRYGFAFIRPIVIAGVAYTLGVVVITWKWPILMPGVIADHELWHVMTLIGLGFQWKFVWQFAAGAPPEVAELRAARLALQSKSAAEQEDAAEQNPEHQPDHAVADVAP